MKRALFYLPTVKIHKTINTGNSDGLVTKLIKNKGKSTYLINLIHAVFYIVENILHDTLWDTLKYKNILNTIKYFVASHLSLIGEAMNSG